jgi:hypothetical protein
MRTVGPLVQQESKIGGRLMGRSDNQEQCCFFASVSVKYRQENEFWYQGCRCFRISRVYVLLPDIIRINRCAFWKRA